MSSKDWDVVSGSSDDAMHFMDCGVAGGFPHRASDCDVDGEQLELPEEFLPKGLRIKASGDLTVEHGAED